METEPEKAINDPSAAYLELQQFARDHAPATLMLMHATDDYAAARCLAQGLLITSLVMGAQAVEKYLKAYLLMIDPARNVRDLSHSLPSLLREVDELDPGLSMSRFMPLMIRFNAHYRTRYPDNKGASTSMTTADMVELDHMILFLNENLHCPRNVKYSSGLYAEVTFSLTHQGQVSPKERWLKINNQALAVILPRIEADQKTVLQEIHSNWKQ